MSRITAIKPADKFKRREKVYLDGCFAFSLTAKAVKESHLKVGQELSDEQVAALVGEDKQNRLLDGARRYFCYRPQSEAELKVKLEHKGVPQSEIEAACARLKSEGLLDDGSFARFWKENRQAFAPRSRRLVRQELKKKGVPEEIIERVAGEIDDGDSAYRAALDKARRLVPCGYQVFSRRLGSYLARRGFSYEVIKPALARVWEEMGGTSGTSVNCGLPSAYPVEQVSHKEVKIGD